MNTRHCPARLGMRVEEVETPALLVDLDALERNIKTMASAVSGTPVKIRPHAKAHKSPDIAKLQIAAGAVGVCCQKVSEAEVMAAAGITDILLSNEVVDPAKLRRLAMLAKTILVGVCVDDLAQVDRVAEAASEVGAEIDVLVEIDVGHNRCGARVEDAQGIATRIAKTPHLRFRGLQAYHGSAQHFRKPEERRAAIAQAVERVKAARDNLTRAGLACEVITGAGTGTFENELASGVYTELQPGSYALMDADYGRNLDSGGQPAKAFENALFVYAQVMSVAGRSHAVLDAGLKAMAAESGLPRVYDRPGLTAAGISDEHTKVSIGAEARPLTLGEKLRLVPGHVDPTANLHDWYVGVRKGVVETLWPIAARGPGF